MLLSHMMLTNHWVALILGGGGTLRARSERATEARCPDVHRAPLKSVGTPALPLCGRCRCGHGACLLLRVRAIEHFRCVFLVPAMWRQLCRPMSVHGRVLQYMLGPCHQSSSSGRPLLRPPLSTIRLSNSPPRSSCPVEIILHLGRRHCTVLVGNGDSGSSFTTKPSETIALSLVASHAGRSTTDCSTGLP